MAVTESLIGPTVERMAKAKDLEIHAPITDQKTRRLNWRITGVVDTLFRSKQISEDVFGSFERFERDLMRASHHDRVIASYSAGAASGSSLRSDQLASWAFDASEVRAARKEASVQKVLGIAREIGWPDRTLALWMAALPRPDGGPFTLAEIGAACSDYAIKAQREAVAKTYLMEALDTAHWCYQNLYGQSSVAP